MAINVIPGSTLRIEVFGEIFNWSGEVETELTRALRAHTGPIRVLINSEGGNATTGLAVNALLSAYPDVTTHNIGIAASAGAMILAAGKTRLVTPGSLTMIHQASSGRGGTSEDLDEAARMLRAMDEAQVSLFMRATGKSDADVRAAIKSTSWMTAQECLDFGLATALSEPEQAAARTSQPAQPITQPVKTILQVAKGHDTRLDMSIREKLGLPADATDEQVAQALDTQLAAAKVKPAPAPAPAALDDGALEAAVTRALERRGANEAHAQACVSAVERFIAEGKIAPATRAQAVKMCGASATALADAVAYWETMPKIIGDVNKPAPTGGSTSKLTPMQARMCKAAGIKEEQFLATLEAEGVS